MRYTTMRHPTMAIAAAALLALAGCGGGDNDDDGNFNVKPSNVGAVTITAHGGAGDDLLTAGLGWDGLLSATAPTFADATAPTADELRRRAIYVNYRALVDITANGGYGTFYGPNVSLTGTVDTTAGAGKIPGVEYIAYSDDGTGKRNVTLIIQIPDNFDVDNACIVTATSSGSRGVYGAVSAAGEWGLKHRCAVAYTDKGTGNGGHDLSTDRVTLIDGRLDTATNAGTRSLFTATAGSGTTLAAFNTAFPNRFAMKHAHSQQNSEKDWGRFTLQAIEFAFYAINDRYGLLSGNDRIIRFRAPNTTVIAASVSNGAGAALAAAEQDTTGLIDGVVVGEPQINVKLPATMAISRGGVPVGSFGKPLYDYDTLGLLYQPCAAYATAAAGSPLLTSVPAASAQNHCARLAAAGLVTGTTFQQQADDSLVRLHQAGWETDSDLLHASHWALATTSVVLTYANAYSRSSVTDNLCGYSFATTSATTFQPAAPAVSPLTTLFSLGNGVPPTNGINIVYNPATGGPILYSLANGDFAFDGAACLRALWTGSDALATRVKAGVEEIKVSANLHGKPAIIVQGRSDTLVPINHASRAYLGTNRSVEGNASKLSYLEVTNAQHFDSFLSLPGYDNRLIPLHVYNLRARDAMWANLKSGTALPASQVIRTTPRGGTAGAAPALTAANVPAIPTTPAPADAIVVTATTVAVPN
ncbi:D-(-)-3-hydroxybutyrate oligomer hydrolase [soil metagenome]